MDGIPYSTWFTKAQAAEAIGVSTKFVEQLAKEKKLQAAKRKQPDTGAWVSVYHPDDVERLRKERNPDAAPFILPAVDPVAEAAADPTETTPKAIAPRRQSPTEFLQALFEATSQNSENRNVRVAERLFLTIAEAADYSGLPQAHLRRLMTDGKLEGLKTGSGWRIRRVDLEKL